MNRRRGLTSIVALGFCCATVATEAAQIPIFIVAGQSNATGGESNAGLLSAAMQQPQSNVLFSGNQVNNIIQWSPLSPPTEPGNSGRVMGNVAGFGPEITLGKAVANVVPNTTVGIVKYSLNGTNLYSDWNPDNVDPFTQADDYIYLKNRVADALTQLPLQHNGDTGYVAGFFWMQGEADAAAGRTTAQYTADLTRLVNRVHQDYGNIPFVIGQIGYADVGSGNVNFNGPNTAAIIQAQMDVSSNVNNGSPNKLANTYFVYTNGFERASNDPIHFDNAGLMSLGQSMGQAFLTATPEPTSLLLLPAGAALLLSRGRRRRRAD
jgi:hypothetical protein